MKNSIIHKISFFLVAMAITITGCDSGDVYPEDNKDEGADIDVTLRFKLTNVEAFPTNYKIVFGSFNDDISYPISSKMISAPADDEEISVSLNNIPDNATYLALYLVQEHSNSKLYPFYTYPIVGELTEDIELPLQTIDLAVFGRVQKQVFSQCLQCHGGSGFAAAGLYLTDDKSYSALVNVTAKNNAEKKLVAPSNILNSYLLDVLEGHVLQNQHSSLSSLKDDDIVLIEQWIKSGAKDE